jgi:hypothetical protein
MVPSSLRKSAFWLLPLLVIIALIVWLSGIFTPWSHVNCWTDSIDINTGRIRHERFFLYCCVSDTTQDSPLTQALTPADLAGALPTWHPVVTLSPGVHHSPHYAFHGAIAQVRILQMYWELGQFSADAKHASARHLLACWKTSGSYFDAGRALSRLQDSIQPKIDAGQAVVVSDLPPEWQ